MAGLECSLNGWTGIIQGESGVTLHFENGLLIKVEQAAPVTKPDIPEQSTVFCSRKKLGQIFTSASEETLDEFYKQFSQWARTFLIESEVQENYFLAQVQAEIGNDLESIRENLNYSCDALISTFSYYRNFTDDAREHGRCDNHSADQEAIGNHAYGGRDDLGNNGIDSGDGYRFRGGGYFQTTGRYNYTQITDGLAIVAGIVVTPEDYADNVTRIDAGLLGALEYWYRTRCYECTHIDCVTQKINPWTDSYEKREELYLAIAEIPAEGI